MDRFKNGLKSYLKAKNYTRDEEASLQNEVQAFLELYPKASQEVSDTYKKIPKFFTPLPKEDDFFQQRLREEARALFLQKKNKELLSNEELDNLRALLEQHITPPMIGSDIFIDYKNFKKVGHMVGAKCKPFFNPCVFSKLYENDPDGRISINQFLGYVTKKFWMHQTRIGLSLYDGAGLGYLKESDLENYIFELIPTLPQLEVLERSFYSFYVCTAVRKFFFFLDPLRTGKVKITEILASGFLDQLIELRDEELSKEHLESNWFSAQSALRVYGQYLTLDEDHNGMLSKQELARYGSGTLTDVFLDRVFQECVTYGGEMDYKSYLDFVLALENRSEPQALQYIFRILDIKQKGYLNAFDLNFFFRAIQKQLKKYGHEPVPLRDIQDEIYDMIKPSDPYKITLIDLIHSGHGETVTNILIDLNSFWTHENRESLVAEPSSSSSSSSAAAAASPASEIGVAGASVSTLISSLQQQSLASPRSPGEADGFITSRPPGDAQPSPTAQNKPSTTVYAGVKLTTSRETITIKVTDTEAIDNYQQILHEITRTRHLRHKNILNLLSCFVNDSQIWITYPFMYYGSCRDILECVNSLQYYDSGGAKDGLDPQTRADINFDRADEQICLIFNEQSLKHIAKSLLSAMDYLHSKHIIHRCICPDNIYVSQGGQVYLSGLKFSVSLMEEGSLAKKLHDYPKNINDYLNYLSPEILQQNLIGYNTKSDIYSLGVTLCELANGVNPFVGCEKPQMLLEKLAGFDIGLWDRSILNPEICNSENPRVIKSIQRRLYSDKFRNFVDLCVQKNYHARPSAAELLTHVYLKKFKEPSVLAGNLQASAVAAGIVETQKRIRARHEQEMLDSSRPKSLKMNGSIVNGVKLNGHSNGSSNDLQETDDYDADYDEVPVDSHQNSLWNFDV